MNGFGIASIPSTGQIRTTDVPRQTTRPRWRVSSVNLNGSSGSVYNEHTAQQGHIYNISMGSSISANVLPAREHDTIDLALTHNNVLPAREHDTIDPALTHNM